MLVCSLERYQYFADWLMRLSIASAMKSANMISKTGRRPVDGAAERRAGERQLGDRRVEDAVGAVALREAGGRLEDAAGARDVLAEEDHVLVALELLVERLPDAARKSTRRHRPRRRTRRRARSGSG